MKMYMTKSWLFAAMLMTTGVSAPGYVQADDIADPDQRPVDRAMQVIQHYQVEHPGGPPESVSGGSTAWSGGGPMFLYARPGANATSAIRKAAEAVRDAKGDDAKFAAQKKLAEVLNKCYDEDMVQREKELKQIEERLAKLRELLERRRAKKQDIIDLQTKVALNEADGLGFYDTERPAKVGPAFAPRVDAASSIVVPAAPSPVPSPASPRAPKAPKAAAELDR